MRKKYLPNYDANHPIFKHYTRKNQVNYFGQKSMALKRKIEWHFTFYNWIKWWESTGHFGERGVKNNQYQMCRFNDVGPYNPNNVYCDLGINNRQNRNPPKRQIILNGITYPSITEASKILKVCRKTIYKKLKLKN